VLSRSFHSARVSWLSCPRGETSLPGFPVDNVLRGRGRGWLQGCTFRVPERVSPAFLVEQGLLHRLEESNAGSGSQGSAGEGDRQMVAGSSDGPFFADHMAPAWVDATQKCDVVW